MIQPYLLKAMMRFRINVLLKIKISPDFNNYGYPSY
jgi:hypothetical protein